MQSIQNASYIMEMWLESNEIVEIFENLKKVNLQHLVKSRTQAFLSTAEKERQTKTKKHINNSEQTKTITNHIKQ